MLAADNDTLKRLRGEMVEAMEGLESVGVVDKVTLKEFETRVLHPTPDLSPDDILHLRESFGVSQAVFARLLNVPKNTLQNWEQGRRKPANAAQKLLDIVRRHGVGVLLAEEES